MFPVDGSSGLPLEETKELQCQVEELISSCSVHVLIVPKNDGSWRMCIYYRAINNIIVKIRGRIFSRKGPQRICFKCRMGRLMSLKLIYF